MNALTLAIDAAATARITRLVTIDDFPPVDAARKAIIAKVGEDSATAELVECPWCAGWWISCAVVALRRLVPDLWDPIARAFALGAVAGWFGIRSKNLNGDLDDLCASIDALAGHVAGTGNVLARRLDHITAALRAANGGS